MVYILEQAFDCQERHICSIHASTPILSSIPSSTKPWKINVFRHFNITKNHQKYLQNTSQPLKNKASIELDQKSQNFLKNLHKIFKKSLYKFPFFLSKIKHFIILTKSKNHPSTELIKNHIINPNISHSSPTQIWNMKRILFTCKDT